MGDNPNRDRLARWHRAIRAASMVLAELGEQGYRDGWPDGISLDTIHALGQATGVTEKAKALLSRDIDQVPR